MTPLKIEMLLHYYCRPDDYRGGDFTAPAVNEALDDFLRDELIEHSEHQAANPAHYVITERGRVYVEALSAVQLPERRWVMPSVAPGARSDG